MNCFLLFVGIWTWSLIDVTVSQTTDETIHPNTFGYDVSNAVVRRIQRSGIFPFDQNLLQRIGFVETSFGEDPITYRPSYYGGIWQVDEDMFNQTKSLNDSALYSKISSTWNIEWNNVTWNDLLKPFYSGLAARLFLHRLVSTGRPIPGAIANQANYWVTNYRNNGSANLFVEKTRVLESSENICEGMMDIAILLDDSGSVGFPNFDKAKNFMASFVETFNLNTSRVSLIKYSTLVDVIFDFNNTLTMQQMISTIGNMSYIGGNTNTPAGLNMAVQLYSETLIRPGVPRLVVTFTDGQHNIGNLPQALINVRNAGLVSYAVGIGSSISYAELLQIGLMDPARVFEINDYDALAEFFHQMKSVICEVPQDPGIGTEQEGELKPNEKRYFKYQVPGIGLIVTLSSSGDFVGWFSYLDSTPNSAVNDGVLSDETFLPYPNDIFPPYLNSSLNQSENATVYLTIQSNTDDIITYKVATRFGLTIK